MPRDISLADRACPGKQMTPPLRLDREIVLRSVNVMVLGALLSIGAAPRPGNLGIIDYGAGVQTLNLCPPSPNCIATSEEGNDRTHYAPPL